MNGDIVTRLLLDPLIESRHGKLHLRATAAQPSYCNFPGL
ncbi:hypothetical protein ACVWZR_001609 [Bradyrhizobium sp. i1.3.1]